MNWSNLLFSFEGRINRKAYLLGLLPVLVLFALLYLYASYLAGSQSTTINGIIMGIVALVALFFFTSLSIKRFNDIGRPAWFLGLLYSPLIIAAIFLLQQKFFPMQKHEAAVLIYTVLIVLAVTAFLWMLVEMLFRRPKEESATEADTTDQNG